MGSLNKTFHMGNLTRDVELRYLPSGMAVADIGLAVNDRVKTQDGEWADQPVFLDITLFGRQAEIAAEYLEKGSECVVEGRLKMDSWQDKTTGQQRTKLKIIGENVQLTSKKGKRQDSFAEAAAAEFEEEAAF